MIIKIVVCFVCAFVVMVLSASPAGKCLKDRDRSCSSTNAQVVATKVFEDFASVLKNDKDAIEICIRKQDGKDVICFRNKVVSKQELDEALKPLGEKNKQRNVVIKPASERSNQALKDVLDACYKNGMFSVSIFTM